MKKILWVVGVLFVLLFSFWAGMSYAKYHFTRSYERAITNLAFGDVDELRKIQSDLNHDCMPQALSRLQYFIDLKKRHMAEYIQSTEDTELKAYITLRDAALWEELLSYSIEPRKPWTIPGCGKESDTKHRIIH